MSTSSQHAKSISDTEAFTALVAAIDRNVSTDRAAELLADFRAEVLREAADIADAQRQFERTSGPRKSAQVSENVGILRVSDKLRRLARRLGGVR